VAAMRGALTEAEDIEVVVKLCSEVTRLRKENAAFLEALEIALYFLEQAKGNGFPLSQMNKIEPLISVIRTAIGKP
jgi:hypothetical protein